MAEQVAESTGTNLVSALANLRKLKEAGDISFKLIVTKQGPARKLFGFEAKDDLMERALHDFTYLKTKQGYEMYPGDFILQLCILRELKNISEVLKNENVS